MKKTNSYDVIYDYDNFSDNLGIKIDGNFKYWQSIEMEDGIILDFDINNRPVSLEILDASKRLSIPKESLNNILFINIVVNVNSKSIEVNAIFGFLIENKQNNQSVEYFTANHYNIPNCRTNLALI